MEKRTKIILGVVGGLVVLGGLYFFLRKPEGETNEGGGSDDGTKAGDGKSPKVGQIKAGAKTDSDTDTQKTAQTLSQDEANAIANKIADKEALSKKTFGLAPTTKAETLKQIDVLKKQLADAGYKLQPIMGGMMGKKRYTALKI
jgi:hypothetical protein